MLANKALSAAPSAVPVYVEDVFSTYLYTGTGSTLSINNGVDLSTKGGLVWTKSRNLAGSSHALQDTVRGANNYLQSQTTSANTNLTDINFAFNSNGFSQNNTYQSFNNTGDTYTSWTFAKQAKFFDVVTWTGNGTNPRNISHNLGSTPGCIIVKRTDVSSNWNVYHRGAAASGYTAEQCYMYFNTTAAVTDNSTFWGDTAPTSTQFTVGSASNSNNGTYVAYLFAHDAGGFGASGTDSIIKCGSFTTDGSGNATVSLGYEPQWLLLKSTGTQKWVLFDNMRGMPVGANAKELLPNTSGAEADGWTCSPTATGFNPTGFSASTTYIYIAIRRGPMKTPTSGTSIFTPTAFSGNDTSGTRSAGLDGFDLLIAKRTASSTLDWVWLDKLRGLKGDRWLASNSTMYEKAEGGAGDQINTINGQYTQNGINITKTSNYSYLDAGSSDYIWYALKRAPGVFDMVAYTGTGSARTVTHNLGAVPELIILKCRVATYEWVVYNKDVGNTKVMNLQSTGGSYTWSAFNDTTPTSSVFSLGDKIDANQNTYNYIAYLFATLPGVTKVGTYTGNGSSQTINCGFTAGARFIMIKRTDAGGAWYVYDTARGIVSGNDSQLRFNSDGVAATGFDAVDPDNSGFIVNNDATNFPINVNAATYIYLAIA